MYQKDKNSKISHFISNLQDSDYIMTVKFSFNSKCILSLCNKNRFVVCHDPQYCLCSYWPRTSLVDIL